MREGYKSIYLFSLIVLINGQLKVFSKEIPRTLSTYLPLAQESRENWELVHLKFLTHLKGKRDLRRPYHILEIALNSTSTAQIHLFQKTDLISPNLKVVITEGANKSYQHEDSEEDSDSEFFRGKIYSKDFDEGQVALFSQRNGGFSGLIITPGGHLLIEPHPSIELVSGNQTLPHLLLRWDTTPRNQECNSKGMRLNPDELVMAEKLLMQDRAMRNFPPPPSISPAGRFKRESGGGVEEISTTASDQESSESRIASRKGGKNVVELAVFTDEDLFHAIRKIHPKDSIAKLKDFVLSMVNTIDLLYEQDSLKVDISFRLVHLEIMKRQPFKLGRNRRSAKAYLTTFCDYAGDKNTNGGLWDHALLLTGMDLREGDNKATAGLAWAGTMCYRYFSCSLSEGSSFGSAYIITHEIGHSLGMEHDGYGVSASCDEERYLMSPTTGAGKLTWSTCSTQNLLDFLEYGSSELRTSNLAMASPPLCLQEMTSDANSKRIIPYNNEGTYPGEKYDAEQQCILSMGKGHKPVMRKDPPFNNICWMLYCGNGTHAISTHPALEGSICGDKKTCKTGVCASPLERNS